MKILNLKDIYFKEIYFEIIHQVPSKPNKNMTNYFLFKKSMKCFNILVWNLF